jgi:C1A family cysteine protease
MNEYMDWTDIEIEQIQDIGYDEDLSEIINSQIPEFDAWNDATDHLHEGHPMVQFFVKKKVPEKVDWRETDGVVTPVKYQGGCGSCWAFSSAGVIEGSYAIKTGKKLEVSEQQLLDCTHGKGYYSDKCNGGYMQEAFRFAQQSFVAIRDYYPYKGKGGTKCK